jgi:hypothetical protein
MTILTAKDAREFIAAWQSTSARRRANMFRIVAESQGANAGICYSRGDSEGERRALAAKRALEQAERAALCEILGRDVACVATSAEMRREV